MKPRRKPPIKCIPCRVTHEGQRYQVESNGEVRMVPAEFMALNAAVDVRRSQPVLEESTARLVRREASRQRRNRNARERNQAMRDLGMVKTPSGWE